MLSRTSMPRQSFRGCNVAESLALVTRITTVVQVSGFLSKPLEWSEMVHVVHTLPRIHDDGQHASRFVLRLVRHDFLPSPGVELLRLW